MMTVSEVLSQTIPIDRRDALKVYAGAQKALILDSIVQQQRKDIDALNKLIELKQAEISQFRSRDTINENIARTYQKEIQVMKDQRQLCEAALKANDKLLKKYKRRIFWRTTMGIVGVGVMVFFYIQK